MKQFTGELRKGEFALSKSHPHVAIVQLHMENLIATYGERYPSEVFKVQFNNWTEAFGFFVVDEAMSLMGRTFGGRKIKEVFKGAKNA